MRAIIPSLSVKGFQAVLACLAKIGDDIVVEARPDRFVLSTINITRSAFATFTFTRTFFESYHLDTTAEAIKVDASGPHLRCTVLAKALVSAFKIRGNIEQKVEKCCLFMNSAEGVGENCRLTVETIFKYGFIKIHKLLYESCPDPLQVIDSIESCPSSWKLPAAALIGFTDNFSSKAEEISMICGQDSVIFKTSRDSTEDDPNGLKKFGTTVVPINKSALDYYRLQDDIEITFSFKEFKAIVAFAVALRLPLEGYFDARCRPLLLTVVSENIVSGNFALATVINEDESIEQTQSQAGQAGKMEDVKTTYTHNNAQNNVLRQQQQGSDFPNQDGADFLGDDDDEWIGELDEFEDDELFSDNPNLANIQAQSEAPTFVIGGSSNNNNNNNSNSLHLSEDEAYEIEDEFMSAQTTTDRKIKKPRYNFDEDD